MPEYAKPYVVTLQKFLQDYEVGSVVDLGCGDWQFSRLIDWGEIEYLGLDVVASVVDTNTKLFATDAISFETTTVGEPLPSADLVVCKDVLQHLPLPIVTDYLVEFRQRYKHILITNDVYPDSATNAETPPGASSRAIRPDLEPFSEKCTLVLEWEIRAFGYHWIKHTYHLSGAGKPHVAPPPVEPVLLREAQAARQHDDPPEPDTGHQER
jgi:SAM-dependent methyltransferase